MRNRVNGNVGAIKEIMIDAPSCRVAYAVLAVGGFLGIGERLFAIPWEALTLDEEFSCCYQWWNRCASVSEVLY